VTIDAEALHGWFVVEVGVRQAWPFLTLSDPESGGEARLYIDTEFRLEPGGAHFTDGDAERSMAALLDLSNRTVTAVERQGDAGLGLRFDDGERALFVSGTPATFTTHDVWWLADLSAAALPDGATSTETRDALLGLQHWYARQCNGDWEHSYGVTIDTLDNPGWSLRVDLTETAIEGTVAGWSKVERSEHNWVHWRIVDGRYEAFCGPTNLSEAIAGFLDQASQAA
jgi:hypothetical protein